MKEIKKSQRLKNCPNCMGSNIVYKPHKYPDSFQLPPIDMGRCWNCGAEWPANSTSRRTFTMPKTKHFEPDTILTEGGILVKRETAEEYGVDTIEIRSDDKEES